MSVDENILTRIAKAQDARQKREPLMALFFVFEGPIVSRMYYSSRERAGGPVQLLTCTTLLRRRRSR